MGELCDAAAPDMTYAWLDTTLRSSRLMRPYALILPVATSFVATAASAQPLGDGEAARVEAVAEAPLTLPPEEDAPSPGPRVDDRPGFEERFLVDHGRIPIPTATPTTMSFAFRGEYQMRLRGHTDLPLEPAIGGAAGSTLGQNAYLYHWLRLKPVFQYEDVLKIVGEIDFPRGLIAGDTTELVTAARDDLAEDHWYEVHPRALYLEYLTPIGLLRVGHQPSHWGMGLLANDGDRPTLFGDYRRGAIVERLLFATRPGGKDSELVIALGGDLVFEDARAQIIEGDRALQAVLAVRWEEPRWNIGAYAVFRHQERDSEATVSFTPFSEDLTIGAIDLAGAFNADLPDVDGYIFGEMEAALIAGGTTMIRNIDLTAAGEEEAIFTFGGAARLGVVHVAESDEGERFGRVAFSLEYGYASGDADPYDGVTRRFSFDQNHNVGLLMFDHVLAWKTARAATIAQDPAIVNRPAPGLQFLPSEGGIFGAQYLNPTVVVRPLHWLDAKAGMVLAQTTADLVDPYHAGALGNYANYDGGDETKHDLGVELDLGVDARLRVASELTVNLGVEGGVLFPGKALDDAAANRYPTQYMVNSKLGAQF
jgi:hypothetical protein